MNKKALASFCFFMLLLSLGAGAISQESGKGEQPSKISTLGKYRGSSQPLTNEWIRASYSREGKVITVLDQISWMKTILEHGYAIASVVKQAAAGARVQTRRTVLLVMTLLVAAVLIAVIAFFFYLRDRIKRR
jgi:hypothetical protein